MVSTQFGLVGIVLLHQNELGIKLSVKEQEAFAHHWSLIGYLLGIEDRFIY